MRVGGQNASDEAKGAFTGEIAAAMLLDVGCRYVILGHSERRTLYGETDEVVNAKAQAALAAGLDADRLRRRDARGAGGGPDRGGRDRARCNGSLAGLDAAAAREDR